ncbi:MAG TPA: NAD-dependent malic enzyme [Spirochaetia bacterium]|nr:NAD-dependent malic enzyme [Spirochaetia bacterium]
MTQFERTNDGEGKPCLSTPLPGLLLTRLPLLNKSTAFTEEERAEFGLEGLFPSHVSTMAEQIEREYANFRNFTTNLDRHVYLRVLQDRNEVLFYALLERYLEEMMPIIYTPTVAEAVQKFSLIYRFPRGVVVSTENIDRIDAILEHSPVSNVRLVVATDSEGILGIGDQGFGGMAICIGKLSLYTVAAGIDPSTTLPIELDVGTNRKDLLDDPLYLGVRHERLTGQAYDDFIDRFVQAFRGHFPGAILQWEDFSKQKAFTVLERYREVLPSFNDDIQGTGAMVVGGLLAAARKTRRSITEETYAIYGAGAAGIGVARAIRNAVMKRGLSYEEANARIFVLDSRGLILEDRAGLEKYKTDFARDPCSVTSWNAASFAPNLVETVRAGKVTALIGLSGQRGAFDQTILDAMCENSPAPIVFPLSNPNENCEAMPADIYRWSAGRAIVATGGPFADVEWEGKRSVVGQGNNAFIFPGLGLGMLVSGASRVTPGMLSAAAEALADYTDPGRLALGGVYPQIAQMQRLSRHVAEAVAVQAAADGVAARAPSKDWPDEIARFVWTPAYLPIHRCAEGSLGA